MRENLFRGRASRAVLAAAVLIGLWPAIVAWAGSDSDGDADCDPGVPVRGKVRIANNNGQGITANDLHFYMYQNDKPNVQVVGASAGSGAFSSVGVQMDSNNNRDVGPGQGPPYHGAGVDMSGGSVADGQTVVIDVMLCMNEKNNLKISDIVWTEDGAPLGQQNDPPNGGWRVQNPFSGGDGGNASDPSGGGQGAQEDNGGSGSFVHLVSIENDDYTNCLLVRELKLLASMTDRPDLDAIDWSRIDPVKNTEDEPPVTIPPRGKWCYSFETAGSYVGGHVFLRLDAVSVACDKAGVAKDDGGGVIIIGDHPPTDLSLNEDVDSLWDSWEEVYDLDTSDDGSRNQDNGPAGDPDHDNLTNLEEQHLGFSPIDPQSPFAIPPGFDSFVTTTPVQWPIGMLGQPPIPADFFGEGSEPFTGFIVLAGVPLETSPCAEGPGAADTIVQRLKPAPLPTTLSHSIIDLEITAMSLYSVTPISVTFPGPKASSSFNVFLTTDPSFPSQGTMVLSKTHPNGGFFNMGALFSPKFVFTEVGDPQNILTLSGAEIGIQAPLTASNVQWQHLAPELDSGGCAPNFVPGYQDGQTTPFVLGGFPQQLHLEVAYPDSVPETGDVLAGYDLLEVVPPASWEFGASSPPIPADIFFTGSPPFEGPVQLEGQPIQDSPVCSGDLGGTSAIIKRFGPAKVPGLGATATIPIELVALSLVSVAPITVGNSFFDVFFDVSPTFPSTGIMTVTRTHEHGGTFDAVLLVRPRIVFTEQGNDTNVRILETASYNLGITFRVQGAPWSDDAGPLAWPGCSSNFVPGIEGQKSSFAWSGRVGTLTMAPTDLNPSVPGDVDGSGSVDALDVQLVINGALGIPTGRDTDINHDGTTDAIDVQLVINAALGIDISGQI